MSRKVLITGAGGQLGKALQGKLMDKYEIFVFTKSSKKEPVDSKLKSLDIRENESVKKIFNEINPDIIINCAAYTDVDENEKNKDLSYLTNVGGLHNLIQASHPDSYFIQISSDYVFQGDAGPYVEEDPTHPINYYGKVKLEAENLLRGSRRKYLIIRPNVLYSEDLFCKGNFFSWIYKSLLNERTISVVTDQISNPTFVPHLVSMIFHGMNLRLEGVFHYGSDDYLSRYDFAIKIAEIFQLNSQLILPIATKELMQNIKTYIARRPLHSGLRTNKIADCLDVPIYSTEYSLQILKKYLDPK